MTAHADVVYVITAKGRIHKGALVDDRLVLDERCNVDDAEGERLVSHELPESASPETECLRCFGEAG